MITFRGQYEHALDAKERITIPKRFREVLGKGAVVTHGLEKCVEIYPIENYEKFERDHLSSIDPLSRKGRQLRRRYHALSVDENLDSAGRLRLPAHAIEYAGLEGACIVVGAQDHMEVWHPNTWNEEEEGLTNAGDEIFEEDE